MTSVEHFEMRLHAIDVNCGCPPPKTGKCLSPGAKAEIELIQVP